MERHAHKTSGNRHIEVVFTGMMDRILLEVHYHSRKHLLVLFGCYVSCKATAPLAFSTQVHTQAILCKYYFIIKPISKEEC